MCASLLDIQNGSQITGSTYVSEILAYVVKIPTANLWHATWQTRRKCTYAIAIMTDSQKWRPKPEILIYVKHCKVQLKFLRQIWV